MTNTRQGHMSTDRPQRYAKQLASHWAEKAEITEDGDARRIEFPDGQTAELTPGPTGLTITVTVPEGTDVNDFGQVVARHLARFGQREELTVDWEV